MNNIEIMVEEHKNIKRMLTVVRKACFQVLKGRGVSFEDFDLMIDFIRNYADNHHHGKEEKFLFREMTNHLGQVANNLINHGMLVEHDLGRRYIYDLSEALDNVKNGDEESILDVIANAIGYANLLNRHIDKEDNGVYPFAQRNLSKEVFDEVDQLAQEFEENATALGTQRKYLDLVEKLEEKYL